MVVAHAALVVHGRVAACCLESVSGNGLEVLDVEGRERGYRYRVETLGPLYRYVLYRYRILAHIQTPPQFALGRSALRV